MVFIESSIFLKTMLVVSLHHSFIPTIYEKFEFVYITRAKENLKFYTCLIRALERISVDLRYLHWIIFWQIEIISKIQSIMFVENYNMSAYNFYMAVTRSETATWKTLSWIRARS